MIDVVIADDHPITRMGLVRIVNSCHDMSASGEYQTVEELIKFVEKRKTDNIVVLLDLMMPQKGGFWAISKIKETGKNIKVVVLSAKDDKSTVLTALKFGATGFVTKEADTKEILEAIRAMSRDERYISPSISNHILNDLVLVDYTASEKLSQREMQTLALASEGHSLTEIAKILKLSVKTISTYKSRIFEKLSIRNNNELIKFAIDNNIHSEHFIDGYKKGKR